MIELSKQIEAYYRHFAPQLGLGELEGINLSNHPGMDGVTPTDSGTVTIGGKRVWTPKFTDKMSDLEVRLIVVRNLCNVLEGVLDKNCLT